MASLKMTSLCFFAVLLLANAPLMTEGGIFDDIGGIVNGVVGQACVLSHESEFANCESTFRAIFSGLDQKNDVKVTLLGKSRMST